MIFEIVSAIVGIVGGFLCSHVFYRGIEIQPQLGLLLYIVSQLVLARSIGDLTISINKHRLKFALIITILCVLIVIGYCIGGTINAIMLFERMVIAR